MQETQIIIPSQGEESHQIKFGVQIGGDRRDVFFRSLGNTKLQGNFEAYLSGVVLPYMKAGGGTLIAEGEVSKKFLSGLEIIQDIYCSWDTSLKRVVVKDESSYKEETLKKERVGAFFSGGVDSFYTLLKRQETITDLIFIHGMDLDLEATKAREMVAAKTHEVALHYGKNLIEIETNVWQFLVSCGVQWGEQGHGAALATVAHLLSSNLHKVYIPSTLSYTQMVPYGSHPLLDPFWSSDSLELIHDGAEATRLDKVSQISKNRYALSYLRVCNDSGEFGHNCCKCEKCIQTMISLKIHNALERCTTFNNEICIKDVYKIYLRHGSLPYIHAQTHLPELEKTQGNEELKKAYRWILNRPEWVWKVKIVAESPRANLLKLLRYILPLWLVNYLRLTRSWIKNRRLPRT